MTGNRTIGRWQLTIEDYQRITVSHGFAPISVAPARDTYKRESRFAGGGHIEVQGIDLWAIIPTTESARELWGIYIVGTGSPIPDVVSEIDLIDTVVMDNGLVWHVFARQEVRNR